MTTRIVTASHAPDKKSLPRCDMNEKPEYIATHVLLKATDIAKFLNISKSMAYRLMQTGEIPTVSIGNAKRVRPSDLHYFININSSETNKKK